MASPISLALVGSWIENGTATDIQTFVRSEAIERQKIAQEALAGCSFEGPPEAFNIWLTLPANITRAEVLSRMPGRQIGIVPSDAFTVAGASTEAFRVCLGGTMSRTELRTELSALRNAILEGEWVG